MSDLLQALEIRQSASHWLIALDRDGTLVPYADRPELARVDIKLRQILDELTGLPNVHVAVISARSIAQLRGDFWGIPLIFAGSYGLEMRFPDGAQVIQPAALSSLPLMHAVRDELAALVDLNAGAIIEDHGYSLCLHWHLVPEELLPNMHAGVARLQEKHTQLKFRSLPTSYEVLPAIEWDKGAALQVIADRLAVQAVQGNKWLQLYAGDSESDTPAFQWANARDGISIRVGGDDPLGAQFVLAAPRDLHELLKRLCSGASPSRRQQTRA